jgi:tetratricopeptide (TPR) repeat protein
VPEYQLELGGSYCNFGSWVADQGKPADSMPWFDLAIRTLTPVHEKEPRNLLARKWLRNSHSGRAWAYDAIAKPAEAVKDWDRAVALSPTAEKPAYRAWRTTSRLQAGQFAEALAEVAELTKSSNMQAGQWYNFACYYAVASGKIADKKLEYADRAMELLQHAVKAGWKDAAHMKKDTDLDPLREREGFKKLIAELERDAAATNPSVEKKP